MGASLVSYRHNFLVGIVLRRTLISGLLMKKMFHLKAEFL